MKILLAIAIFLMLAWLLVRVFLALTAAAFHLLWIMAILCFLIWIVLKLKQK